MIEPTPYERVHWRLVNSLGRLAGWAFMIGGIIGTVSCALFLIPFEPASRPADFGTGEAGAGVVASLVVAGLGMVILKAKPYYPEQLKEWFETQDRKDAQPGVRR